MYMYVMYVIIFVSNKFIVEELYEKRSFILYETNLRSGDVPTDWKVYVINVEDMLDKTTPYYVAGGTAESTAAYGFKIANGSSGTVDIAYFAVCDNWSEIDSIVGNDGVVLTNWETPANDVTLTPADIDNKVAAEATK